MYYAQLKAAFSSTLAQFKASFVSDAIAISDAYSRSSVNLTGSSVTGSGDSALIAIKPRVQESEVNGQSRWLEPSARVTGVNGFRPTFRFLDYGQGEGKYNGYPWQTTRRPMYSYDRETWHYFDTQTIGGDYIEFRHNTAFTADTVYIGRSRQISPEQAGAWLDDLGSTYPTLIGPTPTAASFTPTLTTWSGQDYIADEYSAQTNELGGAIPQTPFYAAQINDTSLMPGSGVKSLAVVVAGVHAGEDHSWYAMREFIEYLLGNSVEAQNLRRYYKILLYPMLNAPGSEGGGYRGSFTQGTGGADDANRHFHETTSALEIVDKPKAVMVSDMAGDNPVWMLDWHGMFASNWGVFIDSGNTLQDSLRNRLASNSGFTVGDVGDTVAGFTTRYFQDTIGAELTATIEHGDATAVTDANLATWGQAAVESLDSMRVDGLIGPSNAMSVGLAGETNNALSLTAGHVVTVGQAASTESAFSLSWSKLLGIGLADESDSALSMSYSASTVVPIGVSSEVDSALQVARAKTLAIGQSDETDTALAVAAQKSLSIGLSGEADSALDVSIAKALSLDISVEADAALAFAYPQTIAIGVSQETDQALSFSAALAGGVIAAARATRRTYTSRPSYTASSRPAAISRSRRN